MKNIPKQAYTTEFKELAVKRVAEGSAIAVVVKELGMGDQTLRNWVKAAAEVARLKRENEIIKKQRRISRGMFCEVRLDGGAQ